jgi:hypothetical protein
MGRLGSDVLALACIAGGALVGAGVTAGVAARGADSHDVRVVTKHCVVTEAPKVVVRLHSRDGEATVRSHYTPRAEAGEPGSCATVTASSVHVIRTAEWTEELGQQLDAARAEYEELQLHADELRLKADELRLSSDLARLRADDLSFEADGIFVEGDRIRLRGKELRFESQEQTVVLESLNELLADMRGSEAEVSDLREALDKVRALSELSGSMDQPRIRFQIYRPEAPEAPEAPAAPVPPAAPAAAAAPAPPAPPAAGGGGN